MALNVELTEYQMAQGEYFRDRVSNLEGLLEKHFGGRVAGTVETHYNGSPVECYVVEDVSVDGVERVVAGKVEHSTKKDSLAVAFEEVEPTELSPSADPTEAINAKNEFLHTVTGRTAEDRKRSWENKVED